MRAESVAHFLLYLAVARLVLQAMKKEEVLLLSIRPEYAEKIFNRTKTVELRRTRPARLQPQGTTAVVYVSSPVKALMGSFVVEQAIEAAPALLWKRVAAVAGVTRQEYDRYYAGTARGVGLLIRDVQVFQRPIGLERLRAFGVRPPQSYGYLDAAVVRGLLDFVCLSDPE